MKKTFEVSIIETQRKNIFVETDDDVEWKEVQSWLSKTYQKGQVALESVTYKDNDTCTDDTEKYTIRLSRNGDTLESSPSPKTSWTDNITPNDMLDKIQKLRSKIISFIASSYPQFKFKHGNMPFAYHSTNDSILIKELCIINEEPSVIYENDVFESLEELSIDELYNILRSLSN